MSEYSLQGNVRPVRILPPAAMRHLGDMQTPRKTGAAHHGQRGAYMSAEKLAQFGSGGIKLRQWRWYRDRMTIAKLSDLSGVPGGTISGIEAGEANPTLDVVGKLAKALEVEIGDLFYWNPLDDAPILATWQAATDEQRRIIREHADIVVKPTRR